MDRQTVYHHEDHLRMEGEFVGERRTDYSATRGERAAVRKPQDNLRPEGEFAGRVREEAPKKGDRAPITRPRDNLRPEGEFDSEISLLFANIFPTVPTFLSFFLSFSLSEKARPPRSWCSPAPPANGPAQFVATLTPRSRGSSSTRPPRDRNTWIIGACNGRRS